MPTFNPDTPRVERKFAGVTFQVPYPFAEGHTLTSLQASWVNSALASTLGNHYAGDTRRRIAELDTERAEAFKAKTYSGPMDASGKKPAPATIADLGWDHQAKFDAKFAAYQLGVSNRGEAEARDPLSNFANSIAAGKVKELIAKKGLKVSTFQKADARDKDNYSSRYTELVAEYRAANPWVDALAQSQLDTMANADGGEMDLGEDFAPEVPEATTEETPPAE